MNSPRLIQGRDLPQVRPYRRRLIRLDTFYDSHRHNAMTLSVRRRNNNVITESVLLSIIPSGCLAGVTLSVYPR